jgi:hypothetical protein
MFVPQYDLDLYKLLLINYLHVKKILRHKEMLAIPDQSGQKVLINS